jgi:hypothetical protein
MHVRKHIVALATVSLLGALTLPGCALFGAEEVRIDTITPWTGPSVELREMQGERIVVFTASSGGWAARFDRARPAHNETHVFVTLTRPDPSRMVTQALTEHAVKTSVDAGEPLTVYARIDDRDEATPTSPYRPVISAGRDRTGQGETGAR